MQELRFQEHRLFLRLRAPLLFIFMSFPQCTLFSDFSFCFTFTFSPCKCLRNSHITALLGVKLLKEETFHFIRNWFSFWNATLASPVKFRISVTHCLILLYTGRSISMSIWFWRLFLCLSLTEISLRILYNLDSEISGLLRCIDRMNGFGEKYIFYYC